MINNNLHLNSSVTVTEFTEAIAHIKECQNSKWEDVYTTIFSPYFDAIDETYITPIKEIIINVQCSEHIVALACCSLIDLYMQLTDSTAGKGAVTASFNKYAIILKNKNILEFVGKEQFTNTLRNALVHTSFITSNNSKIIGLSYSNSYDTLDSINTMINNDNQNFQIDVQLENQINRHTTNQIFIDLLFFQIIKDFNELKQNFSNPIVGAPLLNRITDQFK